MVRLLNNKEILKKVDEIVLYIKNTKAYQDYLKAESLLQDDANVCELIEKIKRYQKELVNNKGKKDELELKINDCLNKLNTNPIYLEYKENQDEINNMLVIFENKLNKYFTDIFN